MTPNAPRVPNPQVELTLEQLAQMQRPATTHITFSLTLACPLRCAHCIVDAGPDKGSTTMPLEVARRYADQFQELADYGIQALSFTGGEPFLAPRQLRAMSEAGHAAGMICGVVTAAHWAYDAASAARMVRSYPGIQVWDISLDSFHLEFVKLDNVRAAFQAVRDAGKRPTIRFSHLEPMSDEDRKVLEYIGSFATQAELCCQRVRKVGRGDGLVEGYGHRYHPWNKPCVTQGVVIRYDGSIAPCCVNLVEERRHPFQLGDPRLRTLKEIHQDYMSIPLLQMLRVVGFLDVMRWIQESDLGGELQLPLPDDVCDLCPQLLTHQRLANYLMERANTPQNRLRIGVLASRLLNEHALLQRAVSDLADRAEEIEGFEFAAALARQTQKAQAGRSH